MFKYLKNWFVCLLGFHGFDCAEDVENRRCSYCGCYFEGYLSNTNKD